MRTERTIIRRRPKPAPPPPDESRVWRCKVDGVLLGELEDDCVMIRDHRVNVAVQGRVSRVCHKCHTQNVINYPPLPAAQAQ